MGRWDIGRYLLTSCLATALLDGCGSAQPTVTRPAAIPQSRTKTDKIKHVVIIIQMSRSFNDLFEGYPGAKTSSYGYDTKGRKITLKPISLATTWKLAANAYVACDGAGQISGTDCRMDGFNKERWTCDEPGNPPCPIKYPPYSYVPRDETSPYFKMAKDYVLADEMYASNFDASSFGSLQYIISAQDDNTVGYPSGVPGCGGGPHDWIKIIGGGRTHPCLDSTTLGDELDAADISWAYYQSGGTDGICGNGGDSERNRSTRDVWIAYWAIRHICYGPDWDRDIVSPPKQFLSDVKSGNLRSVSWITPAYRNADEAGAGSASGPPWVARLINTVGESKYWSSTAIFVFWDSYGGWYDPEPPQYVDEGGLGFRVPLLVISPYAKRGYVSHVHYEHGSILRFAEDLFGLLPLGASDRRANSPGPDCFDFNRAPRKFVPI